MEGRMNFARVLLVPFVLILAGYLSVCNFNQYSDRTGLKIVAKFPSSNRAQNFGRFAKPLNSPDTYVPGFVNRIEVRIQGTDYDQTFTHDPVSTGETPLNEFDEIGELPYGEYTVSLTAYTPTQENNYEISHHLTEGMVLGSSVTEPLRIFNLAIDSGKELDAGELPFTTYNLPEVVDYCLDVSVDGHFKVLGFINHTIAPYILSNYMGWVNTESEVAGPSLINEDALGSPKLSCKFSGNKLLMPYTVTAGEIDLLTFQDINSNFISIIDQGGLNHRSDFFLDIAFGKVAVVWIDNGDDHVKGKIFDELLLDQTNAIRDTVSEIDLMTDHVYSNPKVKILDNENVLVTAMTPAPLPSIEYNLYGQIFSINGEEINKKFPSEREIQESIVDYQLAYAVSYGFLGGFLRANVGTLSGKYFDVDLEESSQYIPPDYPKGKNLHLATYRVDNYISVFDNGVKLGFPSNIYYALINPLNNGNIDSANVTNDTEKNSNPRIAVNDDGLGVIVWVTRDVSDTFDHLYYKRYLF
jgi:hypothetical protein